MCYQTLALEFRKCLGLATPDYDSCGSGVSLSWNLDTGRIWAVFDYCLGVEGDIEFIQHLHIWIF